MRFRDPRVPTGDRVEVFIKHETVPKMRKLLGIVGGRIIQEDVHPDYVHMIVEKK